MNRLQSELHRLYALDSGAGDDDDPPHRAVRAMVLEMTRPANWQVLSAVWQGVQSELALPAPAIAVSGVDGLQLWFSLAEGITAAQAHGFLDALRRHFLPDIDPTRVRMDPAPRSIPAEQGDTGNWSAFVAPDLAPVFAETPWLDVRPNEEGQATLLAGLRSIERAEFESATEQLRGSVSPVGSLEVDPVRFLRQVMSDASVPLALRIEAAKALLPYSSGPVER
jgi:hypothetical protein